MYSLGIILYEMSHPPLSTLMERVKILADVRKKEIVFSEIFKSSKKSKQVRKRRRGRVGGMMDVLNYYNISFRLMLLVCY